jgi:Stage II sporulation protein M
VSFADPLRTTASAFLPARLADTPLRRAAQLTGEASLYTVLSCALLLLLGIAQGGLISIFLVAAPLTDRLVVLLEENRSSIYTLHLGSGPANRRAAAGLLCLFIGIALGYAAVAAWLGEQTIVRVFAFAVDAAGLRDEDFLHHSFGSALATFASNLRVALVVLCLGFVYRAYGGMLALAWNACVWASVLSVLLLRASVPAWSRALLAAAVFPHLACEASSYVLVALGAIFTSKALATYDLGDARLWPPIRSSLRLGALAVVGLAAAAVCESWLLPAWVAMIDPR